MTYAEAKSEYKRLELAAKKAGEPLGDYPKGPMGLTPDVIKMTAQWREDRATYETARKRLVTYAAWFVKEFKAEYRAERMARYPENTGIYGHNSLSGVCPDWGA